MNSLRTRGGAGPGARTPPRWRRSRRRRIVRIRRPAREGRRHRWEMRRARRRPRGSLARLPSEQAQVRDGVGRGTGPGRFPGLEAPVQKRQRSASACIGARAGAGGTAGPRDRGIAGSRDRGGGAASARVEGPIGCGGGGRPARAGAEACLHWACLHGAALAAVGEARLAAAEISFGQEGPNLHAASRLLPARSPEGAAVAMPMNLLGIFAAGILTFASPCILPLAPVYLGMQGGVTWRAGRPGPGRRPCSRRPRSPWAWGSSS
jgi:hypothetical protein